MIHTYPDRMSRSPNQSPSPAQHSSVDVLIITALPEERDALLALLEPYRKIQLPDAPTYYHATVPAYAHEGEYTVVVTMLSQMGNVPAAQHTTRALQDFAPDYIMMVGIAGGVCGKAQLGDVVVATQVLYYETEKVTPEGNDQRPPVYQADPILLDRTQNYTDISWKDLIASARPPLRTRRTSSHDQPEVIFGVIASGEKVIADAAFLKQIRRTHAKIVGVEMESFGVAVAAANSRDRPRFIAVRGISDYADARKNDMWHRYAAESAAAFAVGFLRSGPIPPRAVRIARLEQNATLIAIRHQSMEDIPERAIIGALPPELGQHQLVELVIDQSDLYRDGRLVDPVEATQRQIDIETRLRGLLETHPQARLAYYGIAHIPLLFLAGYTLSNRRSVLLFDFNRRTAEWNQLQLGGEAPALALDGLPKRVSRKRGPVVIRISISYEILPELVSQIVPAPVASIHLHLEQPMPDTVTSEHQVREYTAAFRKMMDAIHERLPNATTIHLFYAGPPAVAFSCGQRLSKTIHPQIVVYNYVARDKPPYSWGLDITSAHTTSSFLIRPSGQEV